VYQFAVVPGRGVTLRAAPPSTVFAAAVQLKLVTSPDAMSIVNT
jgi:hypothetical protein